MVILSFSSFNSFPKILSVALNTSLLGNRTASGTTNNNIKTCHLVTYSVEIRQISESVGIFLSVCRKSNLTIAVYNNKSYMLY